LSILLRDSAEQLKRGPHPERARRDAERLLEYLLDVNKAWLIAHGDEELTRAQLVRYSQCIERRLAGEPIQYITGHAEFYGLHFHVTPDVLIPRPETEHLVEKAIELAATMGKSEARELIQNGSVSEHDFSPAATSPATGRALAPANPAFPRILDIGTGSGAIAIAVAHSLPNAKVTAVDISTESLAIASENAARNNVKARIRFVQSDLVAAITGQTYNLIVSNPPYVPLADRDSLSVEVRDHEPALALFAGHDGLDVYRRLIPAALAALDPSGFLALEIGFGQSAQIAQLLASAGFEQIEFTSDLQGILRVASARRPSRS
jgi:release factor glutamine methyltransferase